MSRMLTIEIVSIWLSVAVTAHSFAPAIIIVAPLAFFATLAVLT